MNTNLPFKIKLFFSIVNTKQSGITVKIKTSKIEIEENPPNPNGSLNGIASTIRKNIRANFNNQ